MQRPNKEYKLNYSNNLNLRYGSTDRLEPQVIYINGKTWIEPKLKQDFKEIINFITTNFNKNILSSLHNNIIFSKKYICNFDLKPENVKIDKKTYLFFEVYIKQNITPFMDLKKIKPYIDDIFKNVIKNLETNFNHNSIYLFKSKH